jgi:hypothetical protein
MLQYFIAESNILTSRGNEKKPVFKDDTDRLNFLNTLQHVPLRRRLDISRTNA